MNADVEKKQQPTISRYTKESTLTNNKVNKYRNRTTQCWGGWGTDAPDNQDTWKTSVSYNSPRDTSEHYLHNFRCRIPADWQNKRSLGIQKVWASNNNQRESADAGIRGRQEVRQITKRKSGSIRRMWASNNNSGNLRMQESADGRKPAQVLKRKLGIRGMQESADGKNPTQTTEIGYPRDARIQQPPTNGIQRMHESADDKNLHRKQDDRQQGSADYRNPRKARWGTFGDGVRIRSPGTNGVPREEPRIRFSGYGHQEPTGFQKGRHDVSQL